MESLGVNTQMKTLSDDVFSRECELRAKHKHNRVDEANIVYSLEYIHLSYV